MDNVVLDPVARPTYPMWPTRFFDSIFEEVMPNIGKVFQQYRPSYPADITIENDEAGKPAAAVLTYALAGFKKKEISIRVVGNELHISAVKEPSAPQTGSSVHHGIAYRTMEDSFTLWTQSDKKNIKSKFEDGLLTITVPLKADDAVDIKVE